ncbi:unnamed protein product [Sphagnum troendelagicum]|uniref:MARVEL domain-containing protein n=1 Tax=Sphagnum troendelagicum TaxID=128251 RepID=A0ABP0UWK1_9BRYO
MGNGEISKRVVIISVILFISAFGFALVSESTRSQGSLIFVNEIVKYDDGTYDCVYRGNLSIAFAAVTLLLLLVAQLIVTITTGCLFFARSAYKHGAVRTYAIVAFIISWLVFAIAFLCLIVGAIANHVHTNGHTTCEEVKSAVFAVGAAFTFLTMLMSILYYILISKASILAMPYAAGGPAYGGPPSVGLATYA